MPAVANQSVTHNYHWRSAMICRDDPYTFQFSINKNWNLNFNWPNLDGILTFVYKESSILLLHRPILSVFPPCHVSKVSITAIGVHCTKDEAMIH